MAAPKGHARYGGRKIGTPNKNTEIKELARQYAPRALERLAELMEHDGPVAATSSREILDRAYGKAPQPHDGDGQGGPITIVVTTGVPRA